MSEAMGMGVLVREMADRENTDRENFYFILKSGFIVLTMRHVTLQLNTI